MFWPFVKKPKLAKKYKEQIDQDALNILEILQKNGHEAYLVGGCVRALLLEHKPKDFDISTSATPEEVKKIVPRSAIIGKRFRIVLARRRLRYSEQTSKNSLFPNSARKNSLKEIQITTFRRAPVLVEGKIDENVYGNSRDDAFRRDFAANALFLDPFKNKIVDYVGGLDDIKNRSLSVIGDAKLRLEEDPIRIMRAVRFDSKTSLKIPSALKKIITENRDLLLKAKKERLREEFLKIWREPGGNKAFQTLHKLGILECLVPSLCKKIHQEGYFKIFLKSLKAVENNPWPYERFNTPYFFFMSVDLEKNHLPLIAGADQLWTNLHVSKLEKSYLLKMRHNLAYLRRHQKKVSSQIFRQKRSFDNWSQTFYILHILREMGLPAYRSCWESWSQLWIDFSTERSKFSGTQSRTYSSSKRSRNDSNSGDKTRKTRKRRRKRSSSPRGKSSSSPRSTKKVNA